MDVDNSPPAKDDDHETTTLINKLNKLDINNNTLEEHEHQLALKDDMLRFSNYTLDLLNK